MNTLGLLIASAIPLVMFLLWTEYFKQDLKIEPPTDEEEYAQSVARVRLAGLLTTMMQLVIFLATSSVRAQDSLAAVTGLWITLGALVIQRLAQISLERQVLERCPSHLAGPQGLSFPTASLLRFFWAFAGVVIYLSLLAGSMIATALTIAVLKLSGIAAVFTLGMGTVLGYTLALASNFVTAPWLLKKLIHSSPLPEGAMKAQIESWCAQAKIRPPEIRIASLGTVKNANAWVTGLAWLSGPFRPVLWMTPQLLIELDAQELEAVIKHELIHLRRNHLTSRFALAWAMSLLVLASLGGALLLRALLPDVETGPIAPAFSLFLAVALVWGAFRVLEEQSRGHELEADFLSIVDLGASPSALSNALKKTQVEEEATSHPALAIRLQALEPLIQREKVPQDSVKPPDRIAA